MEISISKQQLAALPVAQYTGSIIVVDKPDMVDSAIARLRSCEIIGFDTETRPSFKKGLNYNVALMQLSSADECYLFRLNKIGLPDSLKALLEDKDITKVGLSIHDDFRNLHKTHEFEPQGFIELQEFVTQWNIIDKSLTKLYGIIFGKRLSKSQRLSNWEADQLAEGQQNYAALDALACVRIYNHLKDGKFDPSSSKYRIED